MVKWSIKNDARAAGMSLSEYIRAAVQSDVKPTDSERSLLDELLVALEQANARSDEALTRLEATEACAAAFDEERLRAETRDRLVVDGEIDWPALRLMFSAIRRQYTKSKRDDVSIAPGAWRNDETQLAERLTSGTRSRASPNQA